MATDYQPCPETPENSGVSARNRRFSHHRQWQSRPVQPGQQSGILRTAQRHHAVADGRPMEAAGFEPFRRQHDPSSIETDRFQPVIALRPKHVELAAMRLCGAPHNLTYVSGEIMWRRRGECVISGALRRFGRHIIQRVSSMWSTASFGWNRAVWAPAMPALSSPRRIISVSAAA